LFTVAASFTIDDPNPRSAWTPTKVGKTLVPPLAEVAEVLNKGMLGDFSSVVAEEVDCPDMREAPFHLASEGICGSCRLADVGGPPYLVPTVMRHKMYNMYEVAEEIGLPGATLIGAGAGTVLVLQQNVSSSVLLGVMMLLGLNPGHACDPVTCLSGAPSSLTTVTIHHCRTTEGSSRLTGCNCELMPNTNLGTNKIMSHFAKLVDGVPVLNRYMANEFGLLGMVLAFTPIFLLQRIGVLWVLLRSRCGIEIHKWC
jgi:hypothetical protein